MKPAKSNQRSQSRSPLVASIEAINATHCTKPLNVEFEAMYTTKGTHPTGSMWAKNPIPACAGTGGGSAPGQPCYAPPQFAPPNNDYRFMGFTFGELPFAIVDEVQVPQDLEEGDYVLGFRYDW